MKSGQYYLEKGKLQKHDLVIKVLFSTVICATHANKNSIYTESSINLSDL